jgi:hypothetical protein
VASSSTLELVLAAVALAIVAVFVGSFRFALRECAGVRDVGASRLPRASLRGGGMHGRAVRGVRLLQASFVAMGITSIFVMVVCAIGIVVMMIAA